MLIADVYIFRSTLSLRRATRSRGSPRILVRDFYPRSPCGERLRARAAEGGTPEFSIHALLAESDRANNFCLFQLILFYPRSPCGERLDDLCIKGACCHFLSTLSLRRATGGGLRHAVQIGFSIHALLAESDSSIVILPYRAINFSIHALLAESDPVPAPLGAACRFFYPRSPCGERRRHWQMGHRRARLFYPRSPCGERPQRPYVRDSKTGFSIHALLAESDGRGGNAMQIRLFSIHALLAESDERRN